MINFTELLNNGIVNPLKIRLAELQRENEGNALKHEALAKELAATNERQEKMRDDFVELSEKVNGILERLDKLEQGFKAYQESQDAMIAALEGLKWNDDEKVGEAEK